jgi:hypothetical protein
MGRIEWFLSRKEIMFCGINDGQPNNSFNPTRDSMAPMMFPGGVS